MSSLILATVSNMLLFSLHKFHYRYSLEHLETILLLSRSQMKLSPPWQETYCRTLTEEINTGVDFIPPDLL